MTFRFVLAARPDSYLAGVFSLAAFLLPGLAIFAPLGVAPLTVVSATLVLLELLLARRRILLPGRAIYVTLLALLAWAAIGLIWSINPNGTIQTIFQLLGIFASAAVLIEGALALSSAQALRINYALAAGIAVAVVIYAIEWSFDSPIQSLIRPHQTIPEGIYSPFNRGLALLLLSAIPAGLALWRAGRSRLAATLWIAVAIVVYVYFGGSIKLALSCGLLVIFIVAFLPKRSISIIGAAFALLVLLAPVATKLVLTQDTIDWASARSTNFSAIHRLVIWRFATQRISERPVTGWGLDSSRVMPGAKTLITLVLRNSNFRHPNDPVEMLPLHPHDMALQWWLELGLPGGLIGAAVIFQFFRTIAGLPVRRFDKALLAGQMTMAIVIAALGYGIWQSWWLCTMVMACVLSAIAVKSAAVTNDAART